MTMVFEEKNISGAVMRMALPAMLGQFTRACFKIAFWQICVTICGRFVLNEGRIAGYVT